MWVCFCDGKWPKVSVHEEALSRFGANMIPYSDTVRCIFDPMFRILDTRVGFSCMGPIRRSREIENLKFGPHG